MTMNWDDQSNNRLQYKHEWVWEPNNLDNVQLANKNSIVTFHPKNSSGTAVVRGNQPFLKGRHYYWEVKLETKPYGTDTMIGVGTKKVDLGEAQYEYCSLLGIDKESWGLSYSGVLQHNGEWKNYAPVLDKGSVVGVHLDTWKGNLEYFINNRPLGVAFTGLRHVELYPMACSTAAASKLKIIRCISEPVSLQMECLSALNLDQRLYLDFTFPFLQHLSRSVFADILKKKTDCDIAYEFRRRVLEKKKKYLFL